MWSRSPGAISDEPRGRSASSSRTITLTSASRGSSSWFTRRPDDGVLGAHRELEHLRAELADRAHLVQRRRDRRLARGEAERARQRVEGGALDKGGGEHHEEDDVEERVGVLARPRARGTWRARSGRPRAGRPSPRGVDSRRLNPLGRSETSAATGRATSMSTAATSRRVADDPAELAGVDEQPQRQEDGDLADPRQTVVEIDHRAPRRDARASQRQTGDVYGDEAGPVQRVRRAERERRGRPRRPRDRGRWSRTAPGAARAPTASPPPSRRACRCRARPRRGRAMSSAP